MKTLLTAAALSIFTSSLAQAAVLNWAHEDGNNDGVWNYSTTNWNFQGANQWGNIPMSAQARDGQRSLYFNYLNQDLNQDGSYTQAFGFALIPTSNALNGLEPNSVQENDAGKDLRAYERLEFWVKGSAGANQSAFHVWLRSPNGHGSVQVPLKNYVTVTSDWQKVSIPLNAFQLPNPNPNWLQLWNVHAVGFYVTQNNSNVPFDFYIDSISFVNGNSGDNQMPETRQWWKEDPNQNGEYNYSTSVSSNGSFLKAANQWGDVPVTQFFTGPYGNTPYNAIDLQFTHNGYGYAEAALTTQVANTGWEPVSFEDRDAGKVISPANASLNFSAATVADGLRVKLVDAQGRSSQSVNIKDYRSSYGRYSFSYNIPTHAFAGNGFDFKAVKSVTFFVDASVPAGQYNLNVSSLYFKKN